MCLWFKKRKQKNALPAALMARLDELRAAPREGSLVPVGSGIHVKLTEREARIFAAGVSEAIACVKSMHGAGVNR